MRPTEATASESALLSAKQSFASRLDDDLDAPHPVARECRSFCSTRKCSSNGGHEVKKKREFFINQLGLL